jgi:hypothetical protein
MSVNYFIKFVETVLENKGISQVFADFAKYSVIQFVPITEEAKIPKEKFYVRIKMHPEE